MVVTPNKRNNEESSFSGRLLSNFSKTIMRKNPSIKSHTEILNNRRKFNEITRCQRMEEKELYKKMVEGYRKDHESKTIVYNFIDLMKTQNIVEPKKDLTISVSNLDGTFKETSNLDLKILSSESFVNIFPRAVPTQQLADKKMENNKAVISEDTTPLIKDCTRLSFEIRKSIDSFKRNNEMWNSKIAKFHKIAEEWSRKRKERETQLADELNAQCQFFNLDDSSDDFTATITEEEELRADAALSGNPNEVLVTSFGNSITRSLLMSLKDTSWLNDSIINVYMELITERSSIKPNLPQVYSMNTFFFDTLKNRGYRAVRRWTKKVDLFEKDICFCPIHVNRIHWTLAIIDFRKKEISYLDSMGGGNTVCLKMLKSYLEEEHNDKKKQPYDTSDWTLVNRHQEVPQQMNGSDCGVFACLFAEFIARDAKLSFSQSDIPILRKKIVLEILDSKLFR